jgi:hypothetical protein
VYTLSSPALPLTPPLKWGGVILLIKRDILSTAQIRAMEPATSCNISQFFADTGR